MMHVYLCSMKLNRFNASTSCRVQLVVVAAAGGARDANPAAAERHWRDAHAPGGIGDPADGCAAEPPPAAFEVAYVCSVEDAHRALQATLVALRHAWDNPQGYIGYGIVVMAWARPGQHACAI